MKLIVLFLISLSAFADFKVGETFYSEQEEVIIEVVNITDAGIIEAMAEDINGVTYDIAHDKKAFKEIIDKRVKAIKDSKDKARIKLKAIKEKRNKESEMEAPMPIH